MKKNLVRVIALALVMIMVVPMLVSCGGPSGTYGDASGIAGLEYKFSGSSVTITVGVMGSTTSFKGKYKMGKNDNGDKTITFTFKDKDAEKYNTTSIYSSGKDDNGKYIALNGIKIYKK